MMATDSVEGCFPPWRVLIVENDPRQRAYQVAILRGWGYDVFVAEAQFDVDDPYQSFRADALQKARDFHCHIALIDVRLKSDNSRTDTSGLELAKELPQLHAIIVSGYAISPSLALDAPSWRYVGKEAGPEALKNAIETTIEQIRTEMQHSTSNDLPSYREST